MSVRLIVAILAFGMNSSAYVAEIFRSGIMAVDNGQFEAGRSLGLNYRQTMTYHHPATGSLKNVLPALCKRIYQFIERDVYQWLYRSDRI